MTESTAGIFRMLSSEESKHWGSAGRLNSGGFEAKIVDTETGAALPPGEKGELWIRGPGIMKGKSKSLYFPNCSQICNLLLCRLCRR